MAAVKRFNCKSLVGCGCVQQLGFPALVPTAQGVIRDRAPSAEKCKMPNQKPIDWEKLMEQIGLAEMLVELRRELLDAQRQAAEEKLQFKLDDIEIELKVGTTQKTTGQVGMKFWVVDASMDGSVEAQKLHTIKLKMKPLTAGEGPTLISSSEEK